MTKIKKVEGCKCRMCEEKEDNLQKHLDHPFYAESNAFREDIRKGQIIYGAGKYKEPFNPFSWTPKELLIHGAQEDVDKWHYKYGLYKHIERMEKEIEDLKASKKENNDQWAKTAMDLSRELANMHNEKIKYMAFYGVIKKEIKDENLYQQAIDAMEEAAIKPLFDLKA